MTRSLKALVLTTSGVLLLFVALALIPTDRAEAQCGSQASSCKNCHEVQGQDPVNSIGDWHTQHAFGDFCAFCHAGNVQATDEESAHVGMVDPMTDIDASCAQCHPGDLQDKAGAYGSQLGVDVNVSSGGGSSASAPAAPADGTTNASASKPAASAQLGQAQNDADLVDYVQRYNEQVLGKKPTNWGNLILIGLIGLMAVGGGSYVVHNEGLVKVSFKDTRPIEGEYPADVVEMVPEIARLRTSARKSLRRLIQNPSSAEAFLNSFEKLREDDEDKS